MITVLFLLVFELLFRHSWRVVVLLFDVQFPEYFAHHNINVNLYRVEDLKQQFFVCFSSFHEHARGLVNPSFCVVDGFIGFVLNSSSSRLACECNF